MKKLLAICLSAVLLLALCACGKKAQTPDPSSANTPEAAQELATAFIRAYCLRDALSYHPLYLHDARQRWEDQELEGHKTEEAFCAVVQQQADEKGLSVTIRSFDDYLRERHLNHLNNVQEKYGEYTVSTEITSSVPMSEEALATLRGNQSGGLYADYVTDEQIAKITHGYTLKVTFRIDGDISDYSESYNVYVVLCDGQWKVADHSA